MTPGQVQFHRAVWKIADNIDEDLPDAHVLGAIGLPRGDRRGNRLIKSADRYHQGRRLQRQPLRRQFPERAVLVDGMDQGPRKTEDRNISSLELQFGEPAETRLTDQIFPKVNNPRRGFAYPLMATTGDA